MDFNSIREQFPDAADLSDAEIATKLADHYGMSPKDVAGELGLKVDKDRNAGIAGISSGIDNTQGTLYGAAAAVGDFLGVDKVKKWGERGADANEAESRLNQRDDLSGVENLHWSNAGPWIAHAVGQQAPNMALSLAAGAVVPEAAIPAAVSKGLSFLPKAVGGGSMGKALAKGGIDEVAGAFSAGRDLGRGLVGGFSVNYPQGVGSMYNSAREGGDEHPGGMALLTGVPHALMETAPEAMLFGKITHGSGMSGNILTRVAKNMGVGGASGATSELAQGELENSVNPNLTPEQIASSRLNSGVTGGIVEGLMGGLGGIRGNRSRGAIPGNDIKRAIDNDSPETQDEDAYLTQEQRAAAAAQRAVASVGPQQLTAEQIAKNKEQAALVAAANAKKKADEAAAAPVQTEEERRAAFMTVATTYGMQPANDPANPSALFKIGNYPIYDEGTAMKYIAGFEELTKDWTPEQKALIGSVLNSNAITLPANINPKSLFNAATKFLTNNDLEGVATKEDLLTRIDGQIGALDPSIDLRTDTGAASKKVSALNKLYTAIAGTDSPAMAAHDAKNDAFQAAESKAAADIQAAKDAKRAAGKKAPAAGKTPSKPGPKKAAPKADPNAPSAPVITKFDTTTQTGAPNEQSVSQNPAGVGAVREQGPAGQTGGADAGDVRPALLQSVQSGSLTGGSDGVQDDAGRAAGDGQRAVQRSADNGNADAGRTPTPVTTLSGKIIGQKYRAPRPGETNGQPDTQNGSGTAANDGPAERGAAQPGVQLRVQLVGPRIVISTGGDSTQTGVARVEPAGSTGVSADRQGGNLPSLAGDRGATEQTEVERAAKQVHEFVRAFMLRVFQHSNPDAESLPQKAEFFSRVFGGTTAQRDKTNAQYAKELGVSLSMVKKWSAEVPHFASHYAESLIEVGGNLQLPDGMTVKDLYSMLMAPQVVTQWLEDADRIDGKSEAALDLEEQSRKNVYNEDAIRGDRNTNASGDADTGDVHVRKGSTGESKTTKDTAAESVSTEWEKLEAAYESAVQSGDQDAIDAAQLALDNHGTTAADVNRRRTGIRGAKSGDAKQVTAAAATHTRTAEEIAAERDAVLPRTEKNWNAQAAEAGLPQFAELNKHQQYQAVKLDREMDGTPSPAYAKRMQGITAQNTKPAEKPAPVKKTTPKKGKANGTQAAKTVKAETQGQEAPVAPVADTTVSRDNAGKAWNAAAKIIPGIPQWADLSRGHQETFTEYGPSNWKASDVAKLLTSVGLAPKGATAPTPSISTSNAEEKKQAQEIAQRFTGGEVMWQRGPLALIRTISSTTGTPVYIAANGGKYTRVDISRYTGKAFTAKELESLREQRQKDIDARNAAYDANPLITFDADGIGASEGVSKAMRGIAAEWKQLLGIGARVYVTTKDDARANAGKFAGQHQAAAVHGVATSEGGVIRMADGAYVISIPSTGPKSRQLEILSHEMGHVHEREVFANAPAATRDAILAEHKAWVKSTKGMTGNEFVHSLRGRATARNTTVKDDATADNVSMYWKSFSEWYADQVSRWSVSSDKPLSVVDKFFHKLATALKKFYYGLKGAGYLPNQTVKQFLDGIHEVARESESAQDEQVQHMIGGESADLDQYVGNASVLLHTDPTGSAMLSDATRLAARGVSPNDVYKRTGWYKEDGRWKFEVPDHDADLMPQWKQRIDSGPVPLGAVLHHPALFAAYPQLKNYMISASEPGTRALGTYNPRARSIQVSTDSNRVTGAEVLSTLLHETQHAVQHIEGHDMGSNSRNIAFDNPTVLGKLGAHIEALGRAKLLSPGEVSAIQDWLRVYSQPMFLGTTKELSDTARVAYAEYQAAFDRWLAAPSGTQARLDAAADATAANAKIDKALAALETYLTAYDTYTSIVDMLRIQAYRLSRGETEARNTQDRMSMTPDERLALHPLDSAQGDSALLLGRESQLLHDSVASESLSTAKVKENIERLPAKAQPHFTAVAGVMGRVMNKLSFTGDLVERAEKFMPSATKYLADMRERVAIRGRLRREVEKTAADFEKLTPKEQVAVNAIIKQSTTKREWGFYPSWLIDPATGANKVKKLDPALEMAYNDKNLSDEARALIRNVFAQGHNNLKAMQQAVNDTLGREFDEAIDQARALGLDAEVKHLMDERDHRLGTYNKMMNLNDASPYAPLSRFGNHVIVRRSDEMLANMKIIKDHPRNTPDTPEVKEARKFVRANETKGQHYEVQFAENAVQAAKIAAEMKQAGGQVQSFLKDQIAEHMYGTVDMQGLLYRVRGMVAKGNDSELAASNRAINALLTELHLQLMSEQSVRHSEHRRHNIVGADDNMMRSFYQQGISSASFIAGLHKSKDVQESLDAMKEESDDPTSQNRDERRALYNEIAVRHSIGLETRDNPAVNTALKLTSAWMLLTKPLYYVQQLVQPWTMTLPTLMGRFDTRAGGALLQAYRDVAVTMATHNLTHDVIGKLPPDVRKVVRDLMESGRLNIDLDQEMGDRLKGTDPFNRTVARLQTVAERMEGINRVTSAVAAYRLALPTMGHRAATDYAAKVVYDTHGDYSGLNAPGVMRSHTGRLLTQFRKFQMVQISLIAKLIKQSWDGASPEERTIGRKALAYTLGTAFTMGGLMAMPGYKAIAWAVAHISGGEDEPDDPEAQEARMRRAIGDPGLADLLLKGVPKALGMDMEAIFGGYGGMLSLLPYTKVEDMSRDSYKNILAGVAGPLFGGLGPRMWEGAGKLMQGDVMGAAQQMAPSGVSNLLKGIDQYGNGLTRSNGATILKPEEVGVFDATMTALGLKTNKIGGMEFINRVENTYEAYYRDRSREVEHDYVRAFKSGDSPAMARAREEWSKLNESRRNLGFKTRPMSELFKAPQAARKYETRTSKNLQSTGVRAAGYAN